MIETVSPGADLPEGGLARDYLWAGLGVTRCGHCIAYIREGIHDSCVVGPLCDHFPPSSGRNRGYRLFR